MSPFVPARPGRENERALLPYSGHRIERHDRLGEAWSQSTLDTDVIGSRTYAFNSLGFRGPEWRPEAPFRVFVFGESDAFGVGVQFEETWGYRTAMDAARLRGFGPQDVSIMNFADGGASTAATARMVIAQCGRARPDLALVSIADVRRTEGLLHGSAFPVGAWHLDPSQERVMATLPESGGFRSRIAEQVERGKAFLRHCDAEQGLLNSLRDVLLIQRTLEAMSIPGLAISREPELFTRRQTTENPVIGPLVEQIDPRFFRFEISPLRLLDSVDWLEDQHHFGSATHGAIAKRLVEALQSEGGDDCAKRPRLTPEEGIDPRGGDAVEPTVRSFYNDLPFNFHDTDRRAIKAIRFPSIERTYPDLHALINGQVAEHTGEAATILEVGCGAGWLSHGMALHYGAKVDAIDLTPAALDRARALGPKLGTADQVKFRECNVFDFHPAKSYDLAVSIGVLHHTTNARLALERVTSCVRPGGHVYLGLYHKPARRVFLEEMWRLVREHGEDASFARYRELDSVHGKDETLARSWFRDQVLHPHETQHTLKELCAWFEGLGLSLVSTSINRFEPFEELEPLFERELEYEAISRRALFEENRYFPGFFTALAVKG